MKIRQHRGQYTDSMKTVEEIEPTHEAVVAHIITKLSHYCGIVKEIEENPQSVVIKPYGGIDDRNGWDTHIVTIPTYGVYGFTDRGVE